MRRERNESGWSGVVCGYGREKGKEGGKGGSMYEANMGGEERK